MSEKKLYWHNVIGASTEELKQAEIACEKEFGDILYAENHRSVNHRPLSMEQRAAQFLPFAALRGYEEEIAEAGRETENEIDLSEEEKEAINAKLLVLQERMFQDTVRITYFEKDAKKQGVNYKIYQGKVKKIDTVERTIYSRDSVKIRIESVVNIELL